MPTALAQFPLFRTLDQQSVQRIESACSWRRVAAREWVVDHEAQGTDVFLVLSGHVRVVVSVGGRDTILRDIGLFRDEARFQASRPFWFS